MKTINTAIKNYLDTRKKIVYIGEKFTNLISGNDNIIELVDLENISQLPS